MSEGGFLIKFGGTEKERCFSCKFNYDEWQYEINDKDTKPIPHGINKIEIIVETNE